MQFDHVKRRDLDPDRERLPLVDQRFAGGAGSRPCSVTGAVYVVRRPKPAGRRADWSRQSPGQTPTLQRSGTPTRACAADALTSSIADQPLHQTKTKLLPSRSITGSARTSRFQRFRHRATCAQTNSRAPSIVPKQFEDLWSPSAFRRARDRRSSCRILACHLVVHAKLHLSCGAHPR